MPAMNARFYHNEKIIQLRQRKGLKRDQFAEILKVTLMTVHRIENGKNCSEDLLWRIAQYFNVSFRSLIRAIPLSAEEKEEAA